MNKTKGAQIAIFANFGSRAGKAVQIGAFNELKSQTGGSYGLIFNRYFEGRETTNKVKKVEEIR